MNTITLSPSRPLSPLGRGVNKKQSRLLPLVSPLITFGAESKKRFRLPPWVKLPLSVKNFLADPEEVKKLAEEKAEAKRQEEFIQKHVDKAQIPEKPEVTNLDEIEASKVLNLEEQFRQLEEQAGGVALLLNGNTENNKSLLQKICHEKQIPLLTALPGHSLSGGSENFSPLKFMLEAAKRVAKEQGSSVVYLENMDALGFNRNRSNFEYQYFLDYLDALKENMNVMVVLDHKRLFNEAPSTYEEQVLSEKLETIDFLTKREEAIKARYNFLTKVNTSRDKTNIEISEGYLQSMAKDTSARQIDDNEARRMFFEAIKKHGQIREENLQKDIAGLKAKIVQTKELERARITTLTNYRQA